MLEEIAAKIEDHPLIELRVDVLREDREPAAEDGQGKPEGRGEDEEHREVGVDPVLDQPALDAEDVEDDAQDEDDREVGQDVEKDAHGAKLGRPQESASARQSL